MIKRNASALKILGACIFVCLVFAAGFYARGNSELMTMLGVPTVSTSDTLASTSDSAKKSTDSVSARISEVETLLNAKSLTAYDLNAATDAIMNDLVASTNDPYLKYFNALEYQNYLAQVTQPDMGIGVLFSELDGKCYVSDVFEGSEAAASGVVEGDYIVSIDGNEKSKWTINEVTNALNRSSGEIVHITWCHPSSINSVSGDTYSTNLHYVQTEQANVESELSGTVGYISLHQITSNCSQFVKNEIVSLTNQGATSFVLDLRDVSGGYLTQALSISSLFVQSGTLVQIKTADTTTTRSADGAMITSAPLIVLVNEGTGGAAEVLAASLQDTNRATLVGTTTQGKGSIQVMQPLSFGGAIRYTAASYLTPTGRQIDGNGINPDTTVSNVARQKSIAIEFASNASSN